MTLANSRAAKHPVVRVLAAVTLLNNFGNGLFLTSSALFFTRSVGLSVAQTGAGLAAGGVCGILAGVPMGNLSDRWGPRKLLVTLLLAETLGVLLYLRVHTFTEFLPLVCAVTFIDRGGSAVRSAYVAEQIPDDIRVQGRALIRVVTNIGLSVGAASATFVLESDTRGGYVTMDVINALTFAIAAVPLIRLPSRVTDRRPDKGERGNKRRALTDRPYLLIAALNGIFAIQVSMMDVGLPLWVADSTRAPRLIVSVAFVVNTVMAVALQVRASRGTEEPTYAARACAWSGVLVAVACVLYSAAKGLDMLPAAALLIAAVVVQTAGELLCAAGGWGLSFALADPNAPGAYQGVFSAGFAAGLAAGPVVVAHTALEFGRTGWLMLAGLFLLTGFAMVPATRWAKSRLHHVPATTGPSPLIPVGGEYGAQEI